MRLTPWRRLLRLLSGGLSRKSLAPPASASSVITSAGELHHRSTTTLVLGGGDFACSLRLFRIIQPLTSRCSKFRFKPLANRIQEERLLAICEKENLKYSKEVSKVNLTVLNTPFVALYKRANSLVVRPVFYWMSAGSVAEDVCFLWPTNYSLGPILWFFLSGLVIKWKVVGTELLYSCKSAFDELILVVTCVGTEYICASAGVWGRPSESHHISPECCSPQH